MSNHNLPRLEEATRCLVEGGYTSDGGTCIATGIGRTVAIKRYGWIFERYGTFTRVGEYRVQHWKDQVLVCYTAGWDGCGRVLGVYGVFEPLTIAEIIGLGFDREFLQLGDERERTHVGS